jgi:hypothetical protein
MAKDPQIKMFGVEQVQRMFLDIPADMEEQIDISQDEFMSFVQKSAKRRAPRLTGALAASIKKHKDRQNLYTITVESPYGWFQEHGFTPHKVNAGMSTRAGIRGGPPFMGDIYGNFGVGFVRKNKPFIAPALAMALSKIGSLMAQASLKALKKAQKGGGK